MQNFGQKMENIWVKLIGILTALQICYLQNSHKSTLLFIMDVGVIIIIKEIEQIVDGNYKVTEKLQMFSDLKEELLNQINDAESNLLKEYKYCPKCKEYYRNKVWDTEVKQEVREICTFWNPCEFGEHDYENKLCTVTYSICPMGHKKQKNLSF